MKNLVIVESPAKAKTIEKFLGPDFKVLSSYGHIRDLAKKGLGFEETKGSFTPLYEIPDDKKGVVRELKTAARKADNVWLASDEDREGEAIAWHLAEVLGLDPLKTRRIVFHEITKPAILHALENPRTIDLDRVNAQQARRLLDRIVGFELSPVLWKKIKPALSAGRVQSVAVRLICEREKEIRDFKPEPYFRLTGQFSLHGAPVKAEYSRRLHDEGDARRLLECLAGKMFHATEVTVKPVSRAPLPPFTTSTLQQEASRRLGFSVSQTMRVAQKLYEDGKITYMRTDSLNLSDLARRDIAGVVREQLGDEYLNPRNWHTHSKGAQEAHEAIRPTYVSQRTIAGTPHEQKLYDLIWRRAVASQMADARLERTVLEISDTGDGAACCTDGGVFKAEGEVVKFPGFLKFYAEASLDKLTVLPDVKSGDPLAAVGITATERFTLPPARYSEGMLVKKMEDLGIGRPSTYAPTISTIQQREYVARGEKEGEKRDYVTLTLRDGAVERNILSETTGSEKGKLIPTDVGMIVNEFLTRNFPDILDYNFTARVEEKFDEIAEGKLGWTDEISTFYSGFHPQIEEISSQRQDHKVGERLLGQDPSNGRNVYVKIGRYGPVVQIGEAGEDEKPLFASLLPGQSIASITLEDALKLFELPREVGQYEGKKVVAAIGRFGPYIRFDGKFVSIPKTLTPQGISLDEAVALIEEKRTKDAASLLRVFDNIPGLCIRQKRFGPMLEYLPEGAKKAELIKIPKGVDPMAITDEEARKMIADHTPAPAKRKK